FVFLHQSFFQPELTQRHGLFHMAINTLFYLRIYNSVIPELITVPFDIIYTQDDELFLTLMEAQDDEQRNCFHSFIIQQDPFKRKEIFNKMCRNIKRVSKI